MSFIDKGLQYWLPHYIWQQLKRKSCRKHPGPFHIMFCLVDHYEPFHGGASFDKAKWRVAQWMKHYPEMADRHNDADGKTPQHTWFYPPHLDHIFLKDLVWLCKSGYGDIEMHLHHNHMDPFPDTSETLRAKIMKCVDDYANQYGIFCLPDGSRQFAFVHGDWSLDNSRGDKFCGVNNEIQILCECGCFADFTFPSLGVTQPAMVNSIYYVKDNPELPKSYNRGTPVCVGKPPSGDLMMIQGITGFRWKSRTHKFKPSIEASNLDTMDYPFHRRIDYWVNNAVSVKGRPEWLFIKLHTHGCHEVDLDVLLGAAADEMYSYLGEKYNDGEKYILHYVSAREMYNIVKSAEAGKTGNPGAYRNFLIPQYKYIG